MPPPGRGLPSPRRATATAPIAVFDIINPVRRTETPEAAALYRAEPYVLPGDVLGAAPHTGRAGWTWYTGAAAWTWKLGVEGILGLRIVDGKLDLGPCLPRHWPRAEATLALPGKGRIHASIENPTGLATGTLSVEVDGAPWNGGPIPFPQVGSTRVVRARMERTNDLRSRPAQTIDP
jgi:cyclic beta-1,2-glucan synthetase